MFASLQKEVDLYAELTRFGYLAKMKKAKKRSTKARDILNAVCAFDIETTTLNLPITDDKQQNSHGFMYVWQFQINDKTFYGRTWEDFTVFVSMLLDCLKKAKRQYGLSVPPTLIIWVHNLGFEFQYLSQLYDFSDDECFFRDVRKPIYCRMFNCLEFRCSYIQTNMNLKQLTETMGVEVKLSGQKYDYNKIRYPWTELSDYEMEYCIRDVRSLVACMRKKMDQDGDTLQTIPLTSTVYVRRDCVLSLEPYRLKLKDILPEESYILPHYQLLRQAFRGGNTHANKKYVGQILTDVYSYDNEAEFEYNLGMDIVMLDNIPKSETKYSIENADSVERIIIEKTLRNMDITENDLVFCYKGRLAKLIKNPELQIEFGGNHEQ